MKKWVFFLNILFFGLLQATFFNYFTIFGVKPDLILILVMIASLTFNLREAFAIAIFSGIFKDIFIANKFGIYVLLFPVWSLVIFRLSKKITLDS